METANDTRFTAYGSLMSVSLRQPGRVGELESWGVGELGKGT